MSHFALLSNRLTTDETPCTQRDPNTRSHQPNGFRHGLWDVIFFLPQVKLHCSVSG